MASSPLRPAAPRPGASRSAPLAALRGVVNSPEASGASSVARRAERPEPPSTLKCGRYPNGVGNFPETLERVAAERTCDAVGACELDWWTLVGRLAALAGRWACRPWKFVLGTVIVIYVKGWVERYVLPILRFFSEIPW